MDDFTGYRGLHDISLIIPTYNRSDALALCFSALSRQSASGRFEVVVVDDGSEDDTAAVCAEDHGFPIRYIRQENAGANAARNRAIEAAAAELLLFMNDDTIACPEFVAVHLDAHAALPDPGMSVLGRMTVHPDFAANPLSPLHHDASFIPLTGKEELRWTEFFTCNLSVKTRFLRDHGCFDEALRWHEDIELGERLVQHGMRLFYRPEALGYHWHSLDGTQLLKIADREGAALAIWSAKRPDLQSELHALGLVGPAPYAPALKHRLADQFFGIVGEASAVTLARAATTLSPRLGRAVWRKVFQHRKRRAIETTLTARQVH